MQRDVALVTYAPGPQAHKLASEPESDGVNYLVAYGKVVDDKQDGVYLQGVYFGGIATSHAEAQQLARECVNGVKGGIVCPRIVPHASGQVLEAMTQASKRLRQMESQMIQADEIMARSNRPRTKSSQRSA